MRCDLTGSADVLVFICHVPFISCCNGWVSQYRRSFEIMESPGGFGTNTTLSQTVELTAAVGRHFH